MTDQEYHENEEVHGKGQYVSLKDIIDAMLLESSDDDSYLKNVKRSKIIMHAKQAIREVTRQAANDVLAIEVTVPDSLYWVLPEDYTDYVRVSVVVPDGDTFRLQPLDINNNINVAKGYLQDHNAEIVYDDLGEIITTDAMNGYSRPYKTYKFTTCYQPGVNTSKFSQFGEFKIDERRGCILFSSDLADKEIVLEYVSDGLQAELKEEEITVHKYLRMTIENWVYFACIERKRNVPANEKQRALLRYKTTLHQAKLARANFDLLQIARILRINSAF